MEVKKNTTYYRIYIYIYIHKKRFIRGSMCSAHVCERK